MRPTFSGLVVRSLIAGTVSTCQSALDWDLRSASKRPPFDRRILLVALGSSELAGIAEASRARVM